jgi:hypothetical protein
LPQPVFGYALAKFAHERSQKKLEWIRHLSPNVKSDCKNSLHWIEENDEHIPLAKPIG